jgi:hypothetical protein
MSTFAAHYAVKVDTVLGAGGFGEKSLRELPPHLVLTLNA